jgi:peptide chain release factor 2
LNDFEELDIEFELLKEASDNEKIGEFEIKLRQRELRSFLSGKYDKGGALLSIFSGAGGQDAQDWATILLRMYERYCQRKGFKTRVLEQSFGEAGGPEGRIGIKSVTMEIKGNLAYGFLKNETGVHRLVRISPFNAKSLRQTSFALVEILPQISRAEELDTKVKPEDLKTDFYKASGPGGQYVNKRETAVRITHLPTGIIVTCQSERTQGENREEALKILYSKLYRFYEERQKKELKEIKGEKISASWGNQIRNYVLHPYKLVKDLRTDVESSDVEGILDGDLNQFIEAEIKI